MLLPLRGYITVYQFCLVFEDCKVMFAEVKLFGCSLQLRRTVGESMESITQPYKYDENSLISILIERICCLRGYRSFTCNIFQDNIGFIILVIHSLLISCFVSGSQHLLDAEL